MCGIIGAVGTDAAVPVVMEGLRRFEKRGYDAAGIGVWNASRCFVVRRALGRWKSLNEEVLAGGLPPTRLAMGHTRWGTHGSRTEVRNAHPHVSADGMVMVVHNGDIGNHRELRDELAAKGWRFASETDSEVIANLIADLYARTTPSGSCSREMLALTQALGRLRGKWALVVAFADAPQEALFLASAGGMPLSIGFGDGCMYAASEPEGLYGVTKQFLRLAYGQCVQVRADGLHERADLHGAPWTNRVEVIVPRVVETGPRPEGVPSTLFEIGEIAALARTFVDAFTQQLRGASGRKLIERLRRPGARLIVTGCGSAYHAALYAKAVLSGVCGFEVHAVLASDEDLSGFVLDPERDVLMAVSQSGTTYDTLQMVRAARAAGIMVFALVNHADVTLDSLSDGALFTDAGLEDGVAATKTVALQCLAFLILKAELMGLVYIWPEQLRAFADQVAAVLRDEAPVLFVARALAGDVKQVFVLGKRVMNVIAREGALKLTELAYLSLCAPPQGELKHGPLAAMDGGVATVLLVADDEPARDAALLALSEIRNCEHGPIVVLVSEATAGFFANEADRLVTVPDAHPDVLPLLMLVRLLQVAYWTATTLGRDVDRPRWLAKTVTV